MAIRSETFTAKNIGPSVAERRLNLLTYDPVNETIKVEYEYGNTVDSVWVPETGTAVESAKYNVADVLNATQQTNIGDMLDTLHTHHTTEVPS